MAREQKDYNASGLNMRDKRGESSKSRASMRNNLHGQAVTNEIGQMSNLSNAMTGLSLGKSQMGVGPKQTRDQGLYNQNGYNNFVHGNNGSQVRNSNVANTPGTSGTSKIGIKNRDRDRNEAKDREHSNTNHHAGNMQQPNTQKYSSKSLSLNFFVTDVQGSSFATKKNVNPLSQANGMFGQSSDGSVLRQTATGRMNVESNSGSNPPNRRAQVDDFTPQTNNFIPSSNLSQFLLKKGSNGSLQTFENEYNYKINLENLNSNAKPQHMPNSSLGHSIGKKHLNKKNNLFKEVIVEDEAEDIRGS